MKMTNGIMKLLYDAMNQQGFMENATGATGYALYRNLRILADELKDYDKVINDAIRKYGVELPDNSGYALNPEDKKAIDKFSKAVTPVMNLQVDVNLYQIPKESFELPYCETATPNHYALIEDFVVKQNDDDKDETVIEG